MVDRVIALRREPAIAGLGLGKVGLQVTTGFVPINAQMETSVSGIYAIGDVTAPEERHYSHLSSAGGIVAAENAMGMDRSGSSGPHP